MDDICVPHFTAQQCPHGPACPHAHDLRQLASPERWVLLQAVAPAPPYVIQAAEADKHYVLAGHGTLLRCRSAAHAQTIMIWQSHQPLPLRTWLDSLPHAPPTWPLRAEATGENVASSSSTYLGSAHAPPPCTAVADEDGMNKVLWVNLMQGLRQKLEPHEQQTQEELSLEFGDTPVPRPPTPSAPSPATSSPLRPRPRPSAAAGPPGSSKVWSKQADKERSDQLLQLLRTQSALGERMDGGWVAVRKLLGVEPQQLDPDVQAALQALPANQREQILLSFAAVGFHTSDDASQCLRCIMQEHVAVAQVCLSFLVDQCHAADCPFVHPHSTPGWDLLADRWQKTFRDLDYPVLSYLAKKAPEQQEAILRQLAADDLSEVENLSAYLSVLIFKTQKKKKQPASAVGAAAGQPSAPAHPGGHPSGPASRGKGKGRLPGAPIPGPRGPAAPVDSPPQRGAAAAPAHPVYRMSFQFDQSGTTLLAFPLGAQPALLASSSSLGPTYFPFAALDVGGFPSPGLPTQSGLALGLPHPMVSAGGLAPLSPLWAVPHPALFPAPPTLPAPPAPPAPGPPLAPSYPAPMPPSERNPRQPPFPRSR
eukprot:EG_transcript_7108